MNGHTKEAVSAVLDYNPETGVFTWKVDRRPRGKAGQVAGYDNGSGYVKIGIGGGREYAHRLAFLLMTGTLPPPKSVIDHINGNRGDNRWINLRLVTQKENIANTVGRKNIRTRNGEKWEVRFADKTFGTFSSLEQAKEKADMVRREAAKLDPVSVRRAPAKPTILPKTYKNQIPRIFNGHSLNAIARQNGVSQNKLYYRVVTKGEPLDIAIQNIKDTTKY